MADDPPVPVADLDTGPFLESLADERIELQRCDSCGRHRFPPMPSCPWCGSETSTPTPVAGTGTVYSWIVVHRPLTPAFADEVPYVIASVDLDEGCRMFGRLVDGAGSPPTPIAVGDRVRPTFVHHDHWTELRFTPCDDRTTP